MNIRDVTSNTAVQQLYPIAPVAVRTVPVSGHGTAEHPRYSRTDRLDTQHHAQRSTPRVCDSRTGQWNYCSCALRSTCGSSTTTLALSSIATMCIALRPSPLSERGRVGEREAPRLCCLLALGARACGRSSCAAHRRRSQWVLKMIGVPCALPLLCD